MPFPNKDTQFKPGQSGNPDGYPKGMPNRSTQLRKWVDLAVSDIKHPVSEETMSGTVEDKLDVAQIALALTGNTIAYNAIKEELYGKRVQRIEQTGLDGGPVQIDDISKLSSDELRRRIIALRSGTSEAGPG